jgi:hypothetical protein
MRSVHGCITQPDKYVLQARIKRGGKEHSRSFAFSHYSPGGAKRAAQRWLARKARELPPSKQNIPVRSGRQANNTSGTAGVSRTVQYDKRKGQSYVRYLVHWHDGEKQRNKSFSAGNADVIDERDEDAALTAAKAFRAAYEKARLSGTDFDPRPFLNWKARFSLTLPTKAPS